MVTVSREFCRRTEGTKKESGRKAVQRACLRRRWKLGFSFLCKAVLITVNVIFIIFIAMRPLRFRRMDS